MNVQKPEQVEVPGYPEKRQFHHHSGLPVVAALGMGFITSGCETLAEDPYYPQRTGGVVAPSDWSDTNRGPQNEDPPTVIPGKIKGEPKPVPAKPDNPPKQPDPPTRIPTGGVPPIDPPPHPPHPPGVPPAPRY